MMRVGVAAMLMDILVKIAGRPGGPNRSMLLLGPPGVGMTHLIDSLLCTCPCLAEVVDKSMAIVMTLMNQAKQDWSQHIC